MQYVIGKEGGEIWTDFYAVPKDAPNREGGYALMNFLLDPAVNAKEVQAHGYPSDGRQTGGGAAAEGDAGGTRSSIRRPKICSAWSSARRRR